MTGPLLLKNLQPFARGGHRECYVHPEDPALCIKIRRPDFPLTALRKEKGFPRNLKPLSAFDDNVEEHRVLAEYQRRFGDPVFRHVSRSYGFIATDQGPGLVTELIRDAPGNIARTLKKALWEQGMSADIEQAIATLIATWEGFRVPSRDLLLHNIVAETDARGQVRRLVVIDGLGSPNLLPFYWLPKQLQQTKVARKTARFRESIRQLLEIRAAGKPFPGIRGELLHQG